MTASCPCPCPCPALCSSLFLALGPFSAAPRHSEAKLEECIRQQCKHEHGDLDDMQKPTSYTCQHAPMRGKTLSRRVLCVARVLLHVPIMCCENQISCVYVLWMFAVGVLGRDRKIQHTCPETAEYKHREKCQ